MRRFTWLLALAMVTAVSAFAQDPGMPPPPGQGGPGMPPHPPMGMMMGGPRILMQPDVQAELKLTDEQIQRLREVLPRGRGMGGPPPGGPMGGPPPDGGPGMPPRGGPPRMDDGQREAMEARIKAILSATQFGRYQQLSLQVEGPRAFARKDVVDKLGLTDEQNDRIRNVLDSMRPRPPQPPTDGMPPQPPSFEDMQQRHDQAVSAVIGLLTDAQKQKWSAMVGKPFKFERPQFLRGPGR